MSVLTTDFEQPTLDEYPTRKDTAPALLYRRDPTVWGEVDDGPFDQAALEQYADGSYLRTGSLIADEEVERCRAELRRLRADPELKHDERVVVERTSEEVRSVFEVHRISEVFAGLVRDERVVGRARQILGSDVYVHQSRVDYKPACGGGDFYWHSDFETWHAEDGMPRMRAVSVSIALTDNYAHNGAMMIMPGSHRTFVSCVGETPEGHYRSSLQKQEIGTPDRGSLSILAEKHGIDVLTGAAGDATVFDSNCMHGSSGNITPFPRSNVFIVFNSVANTCVEPYSTSERRPAFLASRDFTPVP